jgi:hypothetical protein
MTYPLPNAYGGSSGNTVSTSAVNNIATLVNTMALLVGAGQGSPICRVATTGSETFTISSGSVTTINGTTIDGVSVSVNDAILVKDAPATTGAGSAFSTQPANGVYYVTAVASNITLQRAAAMGGPGGTAGVSGSGGPPSSGGGPSTPAGMVVLVMAGAVSAGLVLWVSTPNSNAAFTFGTTAIKFSLLTVTTSNTVTMTNKRNTERVGTATSSATPSINTDNFDVFKLTAQAAAITGWSLTGTPNDRDELTLCITDNGTSQPIGGWSTFGTNGAIACGATSLPNYTPTGKKMTMKFVYDADPSKWVLMALDSKGY